MSDFLRGVGHFDRPFEVEGDAATNHCWVGQKTRRIALSCGIEISPVRISHKTRVTDGWTELRLQRLR